MESVPALRRAAARGRTAAGAARTAARDLRARAWPPLSDADADPRLRRHRAIGVAGSLSLAVGSVSAGALPVDDALGGLPVIAQLRSLPVGGVMLSYLGLTLLVLAWLGLGPVVRERRVSPAQLVRVLVEWSLPLAVAPPLYSRDVYSYLAQGAMYRDGLDPYRLGAATYGGPLSANVPEYWQHSTAPYGPVFLTLAAAVMAVAGSNVVLGVMGMRAVMLAALAATARLLRPLARRAGVDEASAVWLGLLNPLLITHVVSGAHNDALLVALLLGAMTLAAARRPLLAATVIAVAVLVKASAVVALVFVVPAVARRLRGRWTLPRAALLVAVVAGTTVSLITELADAWYGWVAALSDTTRVHNGLSISTDLGMLAELLGLGGGTIDPVAVTRMLGLALAAWLFVLILRRTRARPLYGLGLALTMIVVLGPVVHPWYLIWGFVPLAATERDPRAVRWIAGASALMAFYPMPAGGGPTAELAFGVVGVLAAVALYRAVSGGWRGDVLLPELGGRATGGDGARRMAVQLGTAQLNPADLARDGLGQLGELDPADPLVRRELLAGVAEELRRGVGGRLPAGGQDDVRLGDGEPQRVR